MEAISQTKLYKLLVNQQLNNSLGILYAIVLSLILALSIVFLPFKMVLLAIVLLIGLPLLGLVFYDLRIGIWLTLSFGFVVQLLSKYANAPFGVGLDGLLGILLVSLLVRISKEKNIDVFKHPISALVLMWIAYSFIQVLNPWAESKIAWVFTVRSLAGLLFFYFVAVFAFNSKKIIFNTFKVILGLGFFASLYAIKQEFLGYSATEMAWVTADPKRFQLIFQWDRLRVFSLFSDPTTYGILSTLIGLMAFMLIPATKITWKKILLILVIIVSLLGAAFAGSRTPFVLIPVSILFYMILNPNKYVIMVTGSFFVLGSLFVLKSTSNPVIFRIQSAFKPTADASVQVRLDNQKLIQPFIHNHPIGSGLGSTGEWGARFNPDSFLASFAHDSGFVRIAVEAGWIGLILYMLMLFGFIKYAVYYYFRVQDPKIKVAYLMISVVFFMLALASYPQEAIVMLPISIIFYLLLAAIVRLKDFDPAFQKPIDYKKLPQ